MLIGTQTLSLETSSLSFCWMCEFCVVTIVTGGHVTYDIFRSGSMAGFQSLLAKTTISQLLRALTSNDYFLIIQVLLRLHRTLP